MTPEEELVVNVTDLRIKLVSLSYDDLARYPDQHKGKAVSYQGKVIQKVSDTGLRIWKGKTRRFAQFCPIDTVFG